MFKGSAAALMETYASNSFEEAMSHAFAQTEQV
jgi:hypothetical protein